MIFLTKSIYFTTTLQTRNQPPNQTLIHLNPSHPPQLIMSGLSHESNPIHESDLSLPVITPQISDEPLVISDRDDQKLPSLQSHMNTSTDQFSQIIGLLQDIKARLTPLETEEKMDYDTQIRMWRNLGTSVEPIALWKFYGGTLVALFLLIGTSRLLEYWGVNFPL